MLKAYANYLFFRQLGNIRTLIQSKNVHLSSRHRGKTSEFDGNGDRSEPRTRISTFGDYHKLLNYDFEHVNEERVEATIGHPGFSYADYDINAQPKVWMLLKIFESSRFFAHHYPLNDSGRTFRDYAQLTSDRLIFLVASEIQMSKHLYDHNVPKYPLKVVTSGGEVGSTSLSSLSTIYTKDMDIELVRNINKVVSVDKSSRRPLQLPDWWKNKYADAAKNFLQKHPSLKMQKFEIPTGQTGFYQMKVSWSDTDLNEHTNWGTYSKCCVNAVHHCARKGDLKHFNQNLKNGLKSIQTYYYGESLEGDLIDIYCWEDPHDHKKVYFDIHKGQNSINQSVFIFW